MSMLIESSIENLIEEIEKRPALYKKNLKEYSDINLKKKFWEEVCEAIVPSWNELSVQDKIKQGHDVQKKWANLRICFRRELNAQKQTKSGQAATKRCKYVYFKKLLFLLPYMENCQTEGNLEPNGSQDDDDNDESGPSTSTPIARRKKNTKPKQTDLDEALLKALFEKNIVDEDTNFVLSLVPSLKNLNADEKLDAKIDILNIFRQIRVARRVQITTQSIYNYNIQQPLYSFPVHRQRTNIMPSPQPLESSIYTFVSTPSPNLPIYQDTLSTENFNDTAQSLISNFLDDSEIYDL